MLICSNFTIFFSRNDLPHMNKGRFQAKKDCFYLDIVQIGLTPPPPPTSKWTDESYFKYKQVKTIEVDMGH